MKARVAKVVAQAVSVKVPARNRAALLPLQLQNNPNPPAAQAVVQVKGVGQALHHQSQDLADHIQVRAAVRQLPAVH